MTVKLAIVYYSSYGTNHQMATIAADAAREAGAEVRRLQTRQSTARTHGKRITKPQQMFRRRPQTI